MSEFGLLSIAADGMSVQRSLLDIAARNVAAAQASTPEHPYPRLVARLTTPAVDDAFDPVPDDDESDAAPTTSVIATTGSGESADALTEMIAVLDAQRAYESNASVFDIGKRLAERTLDLGRG
ncbi:MAG: hypothetical protein ABI186_08870 [Candidatus Elarobacter sp.]